ncbi:hypothetical protein RBH29_15600 [Herbivorax sp. ANBcel31]|uniref:hypothetical protein n=1 Tax=Herbivorax sp. ANBcel31 TaxID=3069754 RepID=UPI0027AE5473|nr:hypothetical protein [Herbivorax sp. ANBcel31]MDQ2087856.1 hypothetical protein [Herbivorax sp. ANBcel31]
MRTVWECSQTYNAAGNQETKTEFINGKNKGKTSYTYDNLSRLETVTEPSLRKTTYAMTELVTERLKPTPRAELL